MRRIFSILVCLLAALTVTSPALATARSPVGALARVAYPDGDAAVGYGFADMCVQCAYVNNAWAGPDQYVLLAAPGPRLVAARFGGETVRRSAFATTPPFQRTSTRVLRFPGWTVGGLLPAPDGAWYVLLGRPNKDQNDAKVVIEIRKLDPALREVGTAQVKGRFDKDGIYQPFDATASSMALAGTTLLVHTARLIYHVPGDSAPHHQVNLTFAVDTVTMAARTVPSAPYASHSFRQFVRVQSGDDAVYLDHGDAYPRALQLGVTADAFAPAPAPSPSPCPGEYPGQPSTCIAEPQTRTFDIWRFDGSIGDNSTGTTVNGFEVGASHALTVGVSVPHDHPVQGITGSSSRLMSNVYVIATDTATGASRFEWLTEYRPTSRAVSVSQPQLVPRADGRFVVLFTTKVGTATTMHYRLIDEQGQVLATRYWRRRQFAALGEPLLLDTRIFWVGYSREQTVRSARGGHYLYALDVADPLRPLIVHR